MSDTKNPVNDRLTELGLAEDVIVKIVESGAAELDDLQYLTADDLVGFGVSVIQARKAVAALAPSVPEAPTVDPTAELGENETPTKAHVNGFANALGADPTMMMMLMSGGLGGDADLSGMMPVRSLVDGYNPKRRDMFLMFMGHVEKRLGAPIVVIDSNGAINRELTVQYIEELEEGHPAAESNIYFDSDSTPHEVIRVGVDAQSIYDADPLKPSTALRKNGMGVGRINWSNVPTEVRQVAFFAATQTKEIDPTNDGHLSWLRDHMKEGANRLVFHGQAPRAISMYNEAARTGSLPTLRVMLSRNPRQPEIMPRRRRAAPKDLSGIGGTYPND